MTDSLVKSPDGFLWHYGGPETDDHLALGGHEPALYPLLQSCSNTDKAYVNIGAHVGTWAIRLAHYNRAVYAVEGNYKTFERLAANIGLNKTRNVYPIHAAVWDESGKLLRFEDVNDKPTGGSTRGILADKVLDDTVTPTYTLDSLVNSFDVQNVGLISMDVEGAEARVLRGGMDCIMRDRPYLIIELHDGHPGTDLDLREQVYGLLDSLHYEYTSMALCPPEEHLLCRPKSDTITLDEPETISFTN